MSTTTDRTADLQARLERVRHRMAAAAEGRGEAELIVVTKYFPASDVALLAGLGVRNVGENKAQEAEAKAAALAGSDLRWHFIGQLQTNKAKSVVRYASAVHSVDRLGLVAALGKAVAAENRRRTEAGDAQRGPLDCFLQLDLRRGEDLDPGRGGARPAEMLELADAVAADPGLSLSGLMAVAPLGEDPAAAFARLQDLSAELTSRYPRAAGISAGMSRDLEAAMAHGATHLRIGSDVLGPRPAVG
ncbi:YggS family pyridoxal phosphate-dependent enzyme [Arthrobacter gandavensis]|uniref:YggS family pyridoxal phosphate-dependent enzyme n=1 Tax=Arthrobacter gandavensis TaxID=169960 RepID=UPI00189003E5|nr:YggS family pyridoxal phosphate-dependent enzyme [Arthrobacter gandavensis]MBF4994863.1 YggS family pyridoxal phosphate-dependent enzyme [Arthrobacter gandavensis]